MRGEPARSTRWGSSTWRAPTPRRLRSSPRYVDTDVTPVLNELKEKTLEHQPLNVKKYLVLLLEESIKADEEKAAKGKRRRKKDGD